MLAGSGTAVVLWFCTVIEFSGLQCKAPQQLLAARYDEPKARLPYAGFVKVAVGSLDLQGLLGMSLRHVSAKEARGRHGFKL